MTDSHPGRPAVTRRNLLRLGSAAIPAAALLGRGTTPAQAAAPAPHYLTETKTSMQLTWMGHSCIRIEQDGFVTVIDPGILSAPDAADGDTGFLVDGRLFHPGDAFTDPGVPSSCCCSS
jgi:hypothetical protein